MSWGSSDAIRYSYAYQEPYNNTTVAVENQGAGHAGLGQLYLNG